MTSATCAKATCTETHCWHTSWVLSGRMKQALAQPAFRQCGIFFCRAFSAVHITPSSRLRVWVTGECGGLGGVSSLVFTCGCVGSSRCFPLAPFPSPRPSPSCTSPAPPGLGRREMEENLSRNTLPISRKIAVITRAHSCPVHLIEVSTLARSRPSPCH